MLIKLDTSPEWGTEEWWEDPTGCGWVDAAGQHWMFIDKKWRVVNSTPAVVTTGNEGKP